MFVTCSLYRSFDGDSISSILFVIIILIKIN